MSILSSEFIATLLSLRNWFLMKRNVSFLPLVCFHLDVPFIFFYSLRSRLFFFLLFVDFDCIFFMKIALFARTNLLVKNSWKITDSCEVLLGNIEPKRRKMLIKETLHCRFISTEALYPNSFKFINPPLFVHLYIWNKLSVLILIKILTIFMR